MIYNINLTEIQRQLIAKIADETGVTTGNLIAKIVKDHIEEYKKKEPVAVKKRVVIPKSEDLKKIAVRKKPTKK